MDSVPDMPDPQTRTAVTQRITAHVTRGWPTSASPSCATADGTATSLPSCPATASLRLRYQVLAAYLSAHRTMINGSALCAALAVTERD
jgi:hypothetical protein